MNNPAAHRLVIVLFAIAAVGALLAFVVLFSQYADIRENVAARCILDAPPEAVGSENSLINSWVTAFPAGRLCEWRTPGGGSFFQQTGEVITWVGLIGSLGSTAAAFALLLQRRFLLGIGPLAGVTISWLIIFAQAMN